MILKIKTNLFTILNYVLFILTMAFGLYVSNGQALFGPNPEQNLRIIEVSVSTGLFLACAIPLLIINLRTKKYRPNFILLILLSIFAIANIIGLLIFKNHDSYSYRSIEGLDISFVYQLDTSLRSAFIVEAIVFALTNFILLDFAYQIFDLKTFLKVVSFLVLIGVGVFIVISLVTEFDCYLNFFKTAFDVNVPTTTVSSVFTNPNEFAFIISLALFAFLILQRLYKKGFILIFSAIPFLFTLFTMCRSLILLNFLLISACVLIFINDRYFHDRTKRILFSLFYVIFLFVLFGVVRVILISTGMMERFISIVFDTGQFKTFETRFWIWRKVFEVLRDSNVVTGAGHNLFNDLLFLYNSTDPINTFFNKTGSAHNTFLEWFGSGGIVMVLVGLAIYIMILYLAFKNIKKKDELTPLILLLITYMSIRSIMESGSFVFVKTLEFAVVAMFTVVPTLSIYKNRQLEQ